MKIISLCDGMSCGMIALKKLKINIQEYHAWEIDKYAIQTSQSNFPEIKQHGDIFKADFSVYKDADWLIGGTICTMWSISQKSEKRETTAEGIGWDMFQQYVKALKQTKPKYFLYENNNSMSEEIKNSITKEFGFKPILVNSSLLSAQNRLRLYWVGVKDKNGNYQSANLEQPVDIGLTVGDILDTPLGKTNNTNVYYNKSKRIGLFPSLNGELKNSQGMRIYSTSGKSVTLMANGGGKGAKTGLYAVKVNSDKNEAKNTDEKIYKVKDKSININDKLYPIELSDGYYKIRKLTVSEAKRLQNIPEWYNFPVSDTQAYKMLGSGWTCDVISYLIIKTMEKSNEKMDNFKPRNSKAKIIF